MKAIVNVIGSIAFYCLSLILLYWYSMAVVSVFVCNGTSKPVADQTEKK